MNEVLAPRLTLYEKPDRLDPQWQWNRAIPAPGHTNVDFEGRVNFDRLRSYRLARARAALEKSECGALILFDVNNIRYITATKIGEWERDKLCRFALLMRGKEPLVWDFGSAAVHHRLYCDWLVPDHVRAGMLGMRGTVPPAAGLMQAHSAEIMSLLNEAGVGKMPVGVDLAETAMFFELQKAGMQVVDGQQVMLDAREIKNIDEIVLLNQAAAMVDGTYHMIYEELKPGVRENDIVAKANEMLYRLGSDDVEAINAISGERCNPHPHNFTDRLFRPGDQAFFDILQSVPGLSHLLLPHLQHRPRDLRAARRLHKMPRMARQGDRVDQAGCLHRQSRVGVAEGRGLRVPERNGCVWPAVRPRAWAGTA